jgi:hypothetical protein
VGKSGCGYYSIWDNKTYQELWGTHPVIALSFADVKEVMFPVAREKIGEDRIRTYGFGFEGKKVLIG